MSFGVFNVLKRVKRRIPNNVNKAWVMLGIKQDVYDGRVIWFSSDFLRAVGCVNVMSVPTCMNCRSKLAGGTAMIATRNLHLFVVCFSQITCYEVVSLFCYTLSLLILIYMTQI
jgi:hypothetical protein